MIVLVGVLAAALLWACSVAAYKSGELSAERLARVAHQATVTEAVRRTVAGVLAETKLDYKADVERVLQAYLGPKPEPAKPGVSTPIATIEERATLALTESSMEGIREGLQQTYGLSGTALDEAMTEVQRQFQVGMDVS